MVSGIVVMYELSVLCFLRFFVVVVSVILDGSVGL